VVKVKKKDLSIIFNVLIIIFEFLGIYLTIKANGKVNFVYYTEDSNILCLLSSSLFILFIAFNKKIPKWLSILKYISTIGLVITFLTVLFILMPLYGFNYHFLLLDGSLFYHHLICPILAFVTFVFFDDLKLFDFKDTVIGLTYTILYAIILITLNILNKVSGPYPFLKVSDQSITTSIVWFIVLISLSYIISYVLSILHNKNR